MTDKFVIAKPIELELIRIPAGEFWLGSNQERDGQAEEGECPPHRLNLGEFYIARYPITTRQFRVFARSVKRRFEAAAGQDDHPAVNMTWHQALWFCNWLSERAGKKFSLPSEAQWEKAARGMDGRLYAWGDEWEARKLNVLETGVRGTTRVGTYSPAGDSPFGLSDVLGNVWEWTSSLWGRDTATATFKYPYQFDDGREDLGASDEVLRVIRGGAFNFDRTFARCAKRHRDAPYNWYWNLGFRVVMES